MREGISRKRVTNESKWTKKVKIEGISHRIRSYFCYKGEKE